MSKAKKTGTMPSVMRRRLVRTPLIPLVDGYWERARLLTGRGWSSFEPYWRFRESLCSADHWEKYKTYVVEDTKEALGDYRSPLLEKLRVKYEGEEILKAIACASNYEELRKTTKYEIALKPYRKEQMRLRQEEAKAHSTGISGARREEDEQIERIRIWTEVVNEMGAPLGLENSSLGRYSPMFHCRLTPHWDFVVGVDVKGLGFETADTVAKPPGMDPLPIGTNMTWKALAPTSRRKLHPSDPDLISIPQYFFPYERAYSNFWDLPGLEINVRAEMTALQIIWPELAPKLIEGVHKL